MSREAWFWPVAICSGLFGLSLVVGGFVAGGALPGGLGLCPPNRHGVHMGCASSYSVAEPAGGLAPAYSAFNEIEGDRQGAGAGASDRVRLRDPDRDEPNACGRLGLPTPGATPLP
eukprot:gene3770-4717_t